MFCSSQNYIWSKSWCLGNGASGVVFKGLHKKTGEQVAVKTFSENIPVAEYNTLRELKHSNIVKFIAVEHQEHAVLNRPVLIMEFCNGECLAKLLTDPQNWYGLEEKEFLSAMKAIIAAVKYLRENKYYHRDIKPLNIMKVIGKDGKSDYKLIDFGSARKLDDEEKYESMHGTLEYAHPLVIEKRYTNKPNKFGIQMDLWSIGVTLYHIATGSLPFMPYNNRKDRNTMLHIVCDKKPGIISGIQTEDGGDIIRSNTLPKTCLLSPMLRTLLEKLLAGVFESSEEKMWSYETFFNFADDILSRKQVFVFYVNEMKETTLYMKPNETLNNIKEEIYAHFNVENQLLFFNLVDLDSLVDSTTPIHSYPTTSLEEPLFLLNENDDEIKNSFVMSFDDLSNFRNLNTSITKKIFNLIYVAKRHIDRTIQCHGLLAKIPDFLLPFLQQQICKLSDNLESLQRRFIYLSQKSDLLYKSSESFKQLVVICHLQRCCNNYLESMSKLLSDFRAKKEEVNEHFEYLFTHLSNMKENLAESHKYVKENWTEIVRNLPDSSQSIGQVEIYITKLRDLLRPSNNDMRRVFDIIEHLQSFLSKCDACCCDSLKKMRKWFKQIHFLMIKCKSIETEIIENSSSKIEAFEMYTNESEMTLSDINDSIIKSVQKKKDSKKSSTQNKSKKFVPILTELEEALKDNQELANAVVDNEITLDKLNEQLNLLNILMKEKVNEYYSIEY